MAVKEVAVDDLIGNAPEVDIPVTGDARAESEIIEVPNAAMSSSHLDDLAFMEEMVTVILPEPPDDNEARLVTVGVNGKNQYLLPGEPMDIRRKYVEVLARAVKIRYRPVVKRDERTGDTVNRLIPRAVMKHPFTVLRDTAKGHAWLKKLMAAAVKI